MTPTDSNSGPLEGRCGTCARFVRVVERVTDLAQYAIERPLREFGQLVVGA